MSLETKHSIGAYFKSLGINDCNSKRDFWKNVTKVDPVIAEELAPLMSRKKKGSLYEVKNHSLPLSLTIESWTRSFHKSFLNWLNQQKQLKPKRILEIGCDNGLLACWYATWFPDAEVIGIDQSVNGINCAEELAKKQGLTNVSFHRMNFNELTERFLKDSFDLIISVRTFHEIMGPIFISKYWSLPEYLRENPLYGDIQYIQIIDHLLTEDGVFLSCERLENPGDVGKWANLLKEAELHVKWEESGILEYRELGVSKRSPVILASKRVTRMSTLEGMELLYTKGDPVVLQSGRSYNGAKAEFAFHRFQEKAFRSGMYLDMTNHWYMFRFEIWETNGFLLVYSCGNAGHRQLDLLPAGAYKEAEQLLEAAAAPFRHLGPIVQYNSLEERT
ncbi:class I SAM-dependent methyltransferase [Bacillus sp. BRMEA1]|uniref:methyltransferase domain-containing protein n=1 Tax=Neobacillus endophyticus TaxID=2738405 RepID=UPI00156384E2|nr:methyltransferase domain-containing protein [Neobacillus endophyticus]NRD79761.1 class I SAM-dependent methyltransferase [Neobacillus endophyticus]